MKGYVWQKEHERLWNELVPPKGQADTVQGELIRCIGKITDEAYRNGNYNWDGGYIRMCAYLRKKLNDATVFDEEEITTINTALDQIETSYDNPDTSGMESSYYQIAEKVVDWCMAHPELIPHEHDPKLKR
ncbi:MAG: hypothetical protein KY468_14550 [Armatimonadetes bacterium]|nr:hypothetical protein [Armatimonadota bacterium]